MQETHKFGPGYLEITGEKENINENRNSQQTLNTQK